jgi:hypothetical protein
LNEFHNHLVSVFLDNAILYGLRILRFKAGHSENCMARVVALVILRLADVYKAKTNHIHKVFKREQGIIILWQCSVQPQFNDYRTQRELRQLKNDSVALRLVQHVLWKSKQHFRTARNIALATIRKDLWKLIGPKMLLQPVLPGISKLLCRRIYIGDP